MYYVYVNVCCYLFISVSFLWHFVDGCLPLFRQHLFPPSIPRPSLLAVVIFARLFVSESGVLRLDRERTAEDREEGDTEIEGIGLTDSTRHRVWREGGIGHM